MKNVRKGQNVFVQISSVVLFICLTAYLLSIIWAMPAISLTLPLLLLLAITLSTTKEFTNKKSKLLFLLIVLVKFLVLIYQAEYKNIPMGGNDWAGFHRHAITLLESSRNIGDVIVSGNVNLFSRVMAIIYYFFGAYLPLVNLFVFIISISLAKYVHRITMIITDYNGFLADKASLLASAWPISFIFSVTVLREIPITWAVTASVYHFIEHLTTKRVRHLSMAIVLSVIASAFHSGMIGVVVVYFLILSFYNVRREKRTVSPTKIIVFSLISIMILALPVGDLIMQKFSSIETTEDLIERTSYTAGRTAYVTSTPSNIFQLILQTPYRLILFALSPLPWHLRGVDTLLAWIIDTIPQWILLSYFLSWVVKYKPKDQRAKVIKQVLLLIILSTYVLNAWGTSNYGTAMRHRAKVLPLKIIVMTWYIMLNKMKGRMGSNVEDNHSCTGI